MGKKEVESNNNDKSFFFRYTFCWYPIYHNISFTKVSLIQLKTKFKRKLEGNLVGERNTSAPTIKQIPWHPSTSESLESLKNSNILVTPLQGVQLPQAKAPNPHGTLRADIPQSDPGRHHCSLSTRIKDDEMKWKKSFCLQAQCSMAEWNKHCNRTCEGIREVS